jgi:hypothetical protein
LAVGDWRAERQECEWAPVAAGPIAWIQRLLPALGGGLAGREFVGHGEEVVEDCGREVLEADEDAVVSEVVVGGVVEVGRLGEKGGAGFAVDADEDRVGLGGFVGGNAGHEVTADLEGGLAEGGGFFHVGEGQAGLPDGF